MMLVQCAFILCFFQCFEAIIYLTGSTSHLGFKSRFEHFLGMIREFLGVIRHERLGFDSLFFEI